MQNSDITPIWVCEMDVYQRYYSVIQVVIYRRVRMERLEEWQRNEYDH